MIVALRFIRRHSRRTDATGHRISFFYSYSHLTRNTNRPSSLRIQTHPTRPSCTRISCSMIIHYRNKNAGSWKISLAIPTIPTTQTRGCGHSTTRTRQETQRRRYVKWFFFCLYLITRFFDDSAFLTKTTTTTIPAPLPHAHVESASSVSPSPFAVPSRESTSKPREETVHTATINTSDDGNYASLGLEDEGDVDPAPRSDIETRTLLVPILIESRVQ